MRTEADESSSADKVVDSIDDAHEELADSVDEMVDRHPWLETVTQLGWGAKGIVYVLMGLAAVGISQQSAPADDASPQGSITQISEAPLGRALLVVMAIGLLLYSAFRILSVAVIRGHELQDWGDRVGYTFSAVFYVGLAYTAGRAAVTDVEPGDSDSIETLSVSLMESTPGRILIGVGGVVTMAVGVYFGIHKGIQRSFAKHLDGVSADISDNEPRLAALAVAGVAGWIGRGVVTALVGFFVVRAAWRFDPDEARGFDRTLREVASGGDGSIFVLVCAIGLILYGTFSLASAPLRSLEDQ